MGEVVPDTHHQAFVRLRSHTTGRWFVDPELRPKLVADAEAQDSNLTEVAVKILCDRFGVPYEANGRKTAPRGSGDELNLRIPTALYRILSATYGAKYQDGIRQALCQHYGLEVPGRRSAAAAA